MPVVQAHICAGEGGGNIANHARGPKQRRLNRVVEARPSAAQWAEYLSKPGHEGGSAAITVDIADVWEQQDTREMHPTKLQLDAAVTKLQDIIDWICKMKSRKQPPPGDVPAEVWRICLRPPDASKYTKHGVGYSAQSCAVLAMFRRLAHMLACIYMRQSAPWQFHLSKAWELDKHNGKEGCYGIRLVHGLLVFFQGYVQSYASQAHAIRRYSTAPHFSRIWLYTW